jgi:hypothetical protein
MVSLCEYVYTNICDIELPHLNLTSVFCSQTQRLDECHKAKTIELDANGIPKTTGKGPLKKEKSSQTAIAVLELQKLLPRARIVYCSATSVSHPKNLGFMSRLGLWGWGTEHPLGFNQFLAGLKRLGTGAMVSLLSVPFPVWG